MKSLTFMEIAKRLEIAFPEFDIGCVQRVMIGDAKQRVQDRPAWRIVIAEKLKLGGQDGN